MCICCVTCGITIHVAILVSCCKAIPIYLFTPRVSIRYSVYVHEGGPYEDTITVIVTAGLPC